MDDYTTFPKFPISTSFYEFTLPISCNLKRKYVILRILFDLAVNFLLYLKKKSMRREHIILIRRMDKLIRMKATGNYLEFARTLEISPAKLYRLIDLLRDELEAPVIYNKHRGSFEYDREGCISLGFGLEPISKQNMSGLEAGAGYNYSMNIVISHEMRSPLFNIDPDKSMLNLNY